MLQNAFHAPHAVVIHVVAAQYVIIYLVDAADYVIAALANAIFIALLSDVIHHVAPHVRLSILHAEQNLQFLHP